MEENELILVDSVEVEDLVKVNRKDLNRLIELTRSLKEQLNASESTEVINIESVLQDLENEEELSLSDEENLGDIIDEAAGLNELEDPPYQ